MYSFDFVSAEEADGGENGGEGEVGEAGGESYPPTSFSSTIFAFHFADKSHILQSRLKCIALL